MSTEFEVLTTWLREKIEDCEVQYDICASLSADIAMSFYNKSRAFRRVLEKVEEIYIKEVPDA